MKRILLGALISVALAGCASTSSEEQKGAAVEDRGAGGKPPIVVERAPVKPVDPSTKGLAGDELARAELERGILAQRSVFFDYDSNLIKDQFKPVVAAHARYLQQNGRTRMRIEGNADERGSREYNLALGQRRADAVKQMMQILGAKAEQIETVSFGEEKPRCTEAAESCYAQNRRGDIRYPTDQ